MNNAQTDQKLGIAGRAAKAFVDSKLTPLFIASSILLGVGAVLLLPREEEPQIRVPMIDVMVAMPGASAKEVEERVTRPMEQLLWEIPGVEYVYSTSSEGQSLAIVRFYVGEDVEKSLVKLNHKLQSNYDRIPAGVTYPLIRARGIDDVPILALTFHSRRYDHLTLRRLAAQVQEEIKEIPEVSETHLIGGERRQVRVLLNPVKLAARNLSPAMLVPVLQQANAQSRVGALTAHDKEVIVETGGFFRNAEEVGDVVIGVFRGRPVYLRDVARIVDGGEEPSQYVLFGRGRRFANGRMEEEPAVTLSIAKRQGANAIVVVNQILKKVASMRGRLIPADVEYTVTRNYGKTAQDKSDELLFHMAIAVGSVALFIWIMLGWREAGVVGVAIPSTLALTLAVIYLYGFTLNRVTLFALIFSIGILVDDAIVVVENIVRHFHLPENKRRDWREIAVDAVNEVGNPTILATFAVIAAVLPMGFVGGLMGPYMRPIPISSSAAMLWSLIIAFVVTPWVSIRLLSLGRKYRALTHPEGAEENALSSEHSGGGKGGLMKWYRSFMRALIGSRKARLLFFAAVIAAWVAAVATVPLGWVRVKMLPFDNKSEFQIALNMPEGSSLERTAQCAREIAAAIRDEPEVKDYEVYVGVAAPFNFNGLIRHYFLRRGARVACLQVNLVDKGERKAQSHEIAKRVRPKVAAVASRYGARATVAEVPPGPPVTQTLVAEIYGPTEKDRLALAQEVIKIFKSTRGVVDVDWYIEAPQRKARFVIDKEKAALHGVSAAAITQTLQIAAGGMQVGLVHMPQEREDVPVMLEVPRALRSSPEDLLAVRVPAMTPGPGGKPVLVPLRELGHFENVVIDRSIYHKNLRPVIYVLGDVAGAIESPVYAILKMNPKLRELDMRRFGGSRSELQILNFHWPFTTYEPALKWDGEWHITIRVFHDLGVAFAAVLILIYVLMVGWFRSFLTPLIVMVVIPVSIIGILPSHGVLHAFFTANSMIGFMAGAGIIVRNTIILVDFIELRLAEGVPIAEAVIDAGAVRFRPIMLTAMAVVVGAIVILFDPIFQGLAVSLMTGEVIAVLISPLAVPLLYYMAYAKNPPVKPAAREA